MDDNRILHKHHHGSQKKGSNEKKTAKQDLEDPESPDVMMTKNLEDQDDTTDFGEIANDWQLWRNCHQCVTTHGRTKV